MCSCDLTLSAMASLSDQLTDDKGMRVSSRATTSNSMFDQRE